MNTKELIESKKFIAFAERYPNAEPAYLKRHEGVYECQLCTGFNKGTCMQKASIVKHYQRYHNG